jgi:hypothetical protein
VELEKPRWSYNLLMVSRAPRLPGLYALWLADSPVYVGCADGAETLRSCLVRHLLAFRGPPSRLPTHFAWQAGGDPELREARVLAYFDREYGYVKRAA